MYDQTARINAMEEALVWAKMFGLEKVRLSRGEFTVYTILNFKGIGPVYIGIYIRENHVMIAPAADDMDGMKYGVAEFYSGYLEMEDTDNDDQIPVWFDIVEFAKLKIKQYITENL